MSERVLEVNGSLTVDGREAPSEAIATVKLVDTDGEVLAATAFEVSSLPAPFTLHVDPAGVARPDRLLVWALLRQGDEGWGTLELVKAAEGAEIALTRVPPGGSR